MPTFKLTRAPLEELRYKLSILCDEPDLCDDYNITEEQAEEFLRRMMLQKPGVVEVSDVEAAIIIGELENAADLHYHSARFWSDPAGKAMSTRLANAAKPIK